VQADDLARVQSPGDFEALVASALEARMRGAPAPAAAPTPG
jgi:hypothetical protein